VSQPLRVALLASASSEEAALLAGALHGAGHLPALLAPDPVGAPAGTEVVRLRSLPDRPLAFRQIGDGLAHLPHACVALARGRFDVAHAFTPVDALAAVAWARRSSGVAVLTFVEPLQRETIGDRRFRLTTLKRSVGGAGAVLAATDEVRRSLRRLLALDVRVVAPPDAAGHLAVYRELHASS